MHKQNGKMLHNVKMQTNNNKQNGRSESNQIFEFKLNILCNYLSFLMAKSDFPYTYST